MTAIDVEEEFGQEMEGIIYHEMEAERAEGTDDWDIIYPTSWPVLNPHADEARTEEELEAALIDEESGYQLPEDPKVVYYGPLQEGQEGNLGAPAGAPEAVNPERRLWLGTAGLGEANLKITGLPEPDDHIEEKAKLMAWPIMLHTRGSRGPDLEVSEIAKFMAENYAENPYWYTEWLGTKDVEPIQFGALIDDSPKPKPATAHLAVAVAMLWGWLPGKLSCPECGTQMRLITQLEYKDCLEWR